VAGAGQELDPGREGGGVGDEMGDGPGAGLGQVVELGRELGVPTPTHAMLYAVLKPYIMGRPG
jgi:hypothetical protein